MPGLGRVELSAHKVLCSHDHADHGWKEGIPAPLNEIPCPFTIRTMPVFHDDQMGSLRGLNTIHVVEYNGIRVAHLGDLGHDLDDDQIEELGKLDAVLLPIGGTYTLNCQQASDLADRLGVKVDKLKFQGLYAQANYEGCKVFLLKPQTYMNQIGRASCRERV